MQNTKGADRSLDKLPTLTTPARLHDPVYRHLKDLILTGRIPPGTRLREEALAERFRVSRTPLREAISRLAQEHIVHLIPRRGAYATQYTKEELLQILEIREVLEGLAARLAARNLDPVTLRQMRAMFSPARARQMERNLSLLARTDARFHELIVRAVKNQRLVRLMTNLYDQMQMVRLRTITLPGRLKRSVREHTEILEAMATGDPALAEAAARRHIRSVRAAVVEKYQDRPATAETRREG